MYFLLLLASFIVGILIGKPTAPYVSPRSPMTIILVMLPFFFLSFFSENQTMNQIRYLYLALAIGIFTYWTWDQVRKQLPKS